MRRSALLAAAVLAAAPVPAPAGYIVFRVLLDGSAPSDPAAPAPPPPNPGDPAVPPKPAADPGRSIVVVVPVTRIAKGRFIEGFNPHPTLNPEWPALTHPFGRTFLYQDGATVQLYADTPLAAGRTAQAQAEYRHKLWEKDKDPKQLYEIAADALAAGLTAQAQQYCDELLLLGKGKPNLPAEVKRFVDAYAAVGPKLKGAAVRASNADEWQGRLGATGVQNRGHYALVFWDAPADEVTRRLDGLEANFKGFFLWHALRGVAVPVPDKPLVAVLPPKSSQFWDLHKALDGRPGTADAFYAPLHGVLVLSPERLDEAGRAFSRMVNNVYRGGFARPDLLKGKPPKIVAPPMKPEDPPERSASEIARAMTLALVDRYQEDADETAGASREATRQLEAVTGLMPKYVDLPRWVESGGASLFERPRDPVYTKTDTDSPVMTVAPPGGWGAANFVQLKHWKDMAAAGELPRNKADLLRNVLSGAYFDAVRLGVDADPAKPAAGSPPSPPADPAVAAARLHDKLAAKADATAWALTEYLANVHLAKLHQFYRELDKLPRDFPADEPAAALVFGRVFGLLSADGAKLDDAAVGRFADGWTTYMNGVPVRAVDVPLDKPVLVPPGAGGPNVPAVGDSANTPPAKP